MTKKTRAKGQTRKPQEQGGNETIAAPADAQAAVEAQQADPERASEPTAASPDSLPRQVTQEATPPEPKKDRAPSKKDRLVELLRRKDGATIEELVAELGWQAHSVRGAISIAAKRLGVTAQRVEKGRYRLPG